MEILSLLSKANENELQSYFIERIEKFLNQHGRSIIGWDEILEGGLAPNATVMSWRNVQGGVEAAKLKHNVIMAPNTVGLYLDHTQGRSDQEPVSIGGDGRIQKIYAYNPTPDILNFDEKKYILGVQANMWTEYMPTTKKVEYMLMPRILALSEIAWTSFENKNYPNFIEERAPLHLSWFDKTGMNYRVPTAIGAKDTTINVADYYIFNWKPSVKGAKIYYSIDDYKPDETTPEYTQSLRVNVPLGEQRPVKSIVITSSGKRSAITTTWLKNRIPFAAITDSIIYKPGLKYYYVPGNFKYTTEIDTCAATNKGFASTVSIYKIPNKERQYGLIFNGYVYVNEDANFEFSLNSDDGSKLYIDDELLIDNDLKHARFEFASGANLKRGYHKIKVAYFDGGPSSVLQVFIKGTDGKKIELPSVMLFH
jgi:hexosaminidase